jgi:hypothetical protein
MNEYRSSLGAAYQHPNFVISLAAELDVGPDWLFGYLEREVLSGVKFSDGQTVQFGWMLIKFVADDRGDLEVWEPAMDVMPIRWVRGGTSTFRHLMLQREVCSQFGVDPMFPSIVQSSIVSAGFLVSRGTGTLSRDTPEASDSGWVFARGIDTDLSGRHSSLFEVAIFDQRVIPFLALPPGVFVVLSSQRVQVSHGSFEISSDSNTFLRRLVS